MQYQPRNRRKSRRRIRWGRLLAVLLGLGAAAFGLVRLIGYGVDLLASRRTARELRAVYDTATAAEIAAAAETPAPAAPEITAVPAAAPEITAVPAAAPAVNPAPSALPKLPDSGYPHNPKREISSRFRSLRKESGDIVGWLAIGHLIDEPVVQRDDVYYMDHDAKGNRNVNGAIFLDSGISLKTRPWTYILYGHNMKSGAMFGSLRNYENASFYHGSPFIAFDTLYEEGRYVVFAAGNVSTVEGGRNYIDFYALKSPDIAVRQKNIETLTAASVHTCTVDVQPEDQLLLLVTCVENDDDRRIVAARRIREGEDEKELAALVEKSRKK